MFLYSIITVRIYESGTVLVLLTLTRRMTGTLLLCIPAMHPYANGKESAKQGMRFPNAMFAILK
jgi:hypothetical protein